MRKLIFILLLYSCSTTRTYVVVGHEFSFDSDTTNVVRKTEYRSSTFPARSFPIGTVIKIKN